MDALTLRIPTMEYADDIRRFRDEILAAGDEDSFAGCGGLENCESAAEWIASVEAERNPETCPPGWVPADVFIAVREVDNRMVGVIDLRHNLDNPVLAEWGGHIGYTQSVRTSGARGMLYRCCGSFLKNAPPSVSNGSW